MGGIPSAMIDIGSFNNIDGSFRSSVCSSEGNVGMPQLGEWEFQLYLWEVLEVRQEVSKWQMVIDVTGYWRSVLSYVAVLYIIEHLDSVSRNSAG